MRLGGESDVLMMCVTGRCKTLVAAYFFFGAVEGVMRR